VAKVTVINCMILGISIVHHPVIMFFHVTTSRLSGKFLNFNLKAFDETSPPKVHNLHLIQFKETHIKIHWVYVNWGIFRSNRNWANYGINLSEEVTLHASLFFRLISITLFCLIL